MICICERIILKMPAGTKKSLEALGNAALIVAGVIMASIPLALSVAWSKATLVLGLAASGAFGLLCLVFYADTRATTEEQRKDPRSRTMEEPEDEFLSALTDMAPFVYHHTRLSGNSRFQRKMARLKKKLVSRIPEGRIVGAGPPKRPPLR